MMLMHDTRVKVITYLGYLYLGRYSVRKLESKLEAISSQSEPCMGSSKEPREAPKRGAVALASKPKGATWTI